MNSLGRVPERLAQRFPLLVYSHGAHIAMHGRDLYLADPEASLIFDANGDLYGTTALATNRSAQGNVFRMRPPTQKGKPWTLSVIYTFIGSPDGANPMAVLLFDTKGNFTARRNLVARGNLVKEAAGPYLRFRARATRQNVMLLIC